MDISHSSSHSIVAVVTKGTLIYPISRSLQLSHNVTASCSPVTCSWFVCMCVCEERREIGVCTCVCVCARRMTVQLVALLWKWHVPAKLISLLSEFNGPVLPSYLKQNIPLSTSTVREGGVNVRDRQCDKTFPPLQPKRCSDELESKQTEYCR